jgi:uracil-DNA glycosylase family 4
MMLVGSVPFVDAAGAELDRYLRRTARLNRSDFFVTSVLRHVSDDENYKPTKEQIKQDEAELDLEMMVIQPSILIVAGAAALKHILGNDDLDKLAGLPNYSSKFNCPVFVMHHPLMGVTQPDRFAARVEDDFKRLGQFIRGELYVPNDIYQPVYSEVDPVLSGGLLYGDLVGMDTEGSEHRPWCVSFTGTEGFGFVCKTRIDVSSAQRTIFHYALHDLGVLAALGISVNLDLLEDTNLLAYLLGNEPKRLKALAYRHCGMEMDEYEDIIEDAEKKVCRDYFQKIIDQTCNTCKGSGEVQIPWKRQPKCKSCQGTKITGKVKSDTRLRGRNAGVCETGTSSTVNSECTACQGSGTELRFKTEKCEACKGDGTTFGAPPPQSVLNPDGTEGVYKPQSIGRRVRRWLGDGVCDLRAKWHDTDQSIREPVERTIGYLRSTSLDDVIDQKRVINYAARDADATLRVYSVLRPKLFALGLEKAYEIDKSIIPAIDAMQRNGILLNRDYFSDLAKELEITKSEVRERLVTLTGKRFNPASPNQVGAILYGHLGLKAPKVTESGGDSTDEKALQMLKIKYFDHETLGPIIDAILDHRELDKMLGTYVYPLPRLSDRNGRVHTQFSITRTTTGRLASSNPNLQNIPARSELGRRIRSGFIAKEGCVLVSVDLDQIELRVCAHLAQDSEMIGVFSSGKDIHKSTAAKMFNLPFEQVTSDQRRAAKTINFGTLYGMSAFRLRNELALEGIRISKQQAEAFLDAWFRAYPGVQAYMDRCHQQARRDGYVRTLFGHIRRLPNVHSPLDRVREEALRQAGNAPTQGTAAEILKIATANVFKRLPDVRKYGYCELLLNIHDELILEVQTDIAPVVNEIVAWEMANAVQLSLPLGAKGKWAETWGKLKD